MKIAFSCPMGVSLYDPAVERPFGGSEVRGYRFATGLADLGYDVSVLVDAPGEFLPRVVEGVKVRFRAVPPAIRSWRDQPTLLRRLAAWPISKTQRAQRRVGQLLGKSRSMVGESLEQTLEATNADVWSCFGVHEHSAEVVRFAQSRGLPTVLFLASDTDLSQNYMQGSAGDLNDYGQSSAECLFALLNSTTIVAQTEVQQARLASMFGRQAHLVRNPINVHPQVERLEVKTTQPYDVLWVGRADCFSKRADLAMEIARRCPQYRFLMIMNRRDPRTFRRLMAKLPNNVEVLPSVPWREMGNYLSAARLLLNTSDAEGFPNTFLEAAAYGVPVAALTVDPGEMLSQHGCGFCADGSPTVLTEWIQGCLTNVDNAVYQTMRISSKRFIERYHAAEHRCAELAAVFAQLQTADPSGVHVANEEAA